MFKSPLSVDGSTGSSQPISLSFALQQGQATSGPGGTQAVDESVLTGTLKVQGAACFSDGQIVPSQPQVEGDILGTLVLTTFTMDDGSQMSLIANIEDTASSKLGIVGGSISGGRCDGQSIGPFELSRQ